MMLIGKGITKIEWPFQIGLVLLSFPLEEGKRQIWKILSVSGCN